MKRILIATFISLTASAAAHGGSGQYYRLAPCRLLDTRQGAPIGVVAEAIQVAG